MTPIWLAPQYEKHRKNIEKKWNFLKRKIRATRNLLDMPCMPYEVVGAPRVRDLARTNGGASFLAVWDSFLGVIQRKRMVWDQEFPKIPVLLTIFEQLYLQK